MITNITTVQFTYYYIDAYSSTASCSLKIYDNVGALVSTLVDTATNNTNVINSSTTSSDGVYSWNVTCIDHVSNTGTSVTRTFTVDTTQPTITLNSPTNNTFITPGTSIDLSVTDTNIDTVLYQVDGGASQPLASPYDINTTGWSDGDYTIVVIANDTAGNSNNDTFKFTIDGTPTPTPLPSITNETTPQPPSQEQPKEETPTQINPAILIGAIVVVAIIVVAVKLNVFKLRKRR